MPANRFYSIQKVDTVAVQRLYASSPDIISIGSRRKRIYDPVLDVRIKRSFDKAWPSVQLLATTHNT